MTNLAKQFYERIFEQPYESTGFAHSESPEKHPFYPALQAFIENYGLADKLCLEVGSGYGAFQNLVRDYIGIDIAMSAGKYVQSPFAIASATDLPFQANSFDGIWTNYVLEHVPKPERMLREIWRVLKPGGYLFLSAAWQCGPWLAKGYPVRPYSDFDWKGKLIKASIPVRKSVLFRSLKIFPQRLIRVITYGINQQPMQFRYQELEPNYEYRWVPDSAAENSMDPFEVYIWYVSRGAVCRNYPSLKRGFLIRTGPLIFQKPK